MTEQPSVEARDIEEAFTVLEKKHHPTWEIECVQATAVLRAALDSLTAALEEQRDRISTLEDCHDAAEAALEQARNDASGFATDAELEAQRADAAEARAQKAEAVVEAARVYRKAVLGDHGQELTDAILGFEAALTAYDEPPTEQA